MGWGQFLRYTLTKTNSSLTTETFVGSMEVFFFLKSCPLSLALKFYEILKQKTSTVLAFGQMMEPLKIHCFGPAPGVFEQRSPWLSTTC